MLKVNGLTKSYGKKLALNDVSFSVNSSSIVGLVGENGAGKSTLLNIISGKLYADFGSVNVSGYDSVKDELHSKFNIGFMPDIPPLYGDLTALEYLNYCMKLKRIKTTIFKSHLSELVEKLSIEKHLNYRCKNLSHGLKQRLSLAQALIGAPDILLLDEPTNGLDPTQIKDFCELIKEFSKQKITLFSTHNLPIANSICSRALLLKNGCLIADNELNSNKSGFCFNVKLLSNNLSIDKINTLKSINKLVDFKSNDNELSLRLLVNDKLSFIKELNILCFASNSIIQELSEQKKPLEEIYFENMLGLKK